MVSPNGESFLNFWVHLSLDRTEFFLIGAI
jgi:hypothetical protein